MFKYLIIFICCLIGLWSSLSYADKLGNYTFTKTLVNSDYIPVVTGLSTSNQNINWYDLKEMVSKNINWTDVRALSCVGGCNSGINWTAFGV